MVEHGGKTPKYHQRVASSQQGREGIARVWLSRVQKRASKLTKKRWGSSSSTSSKKSSRSLGESSLVVPTKANLFLTPPARSPSSSTPPSTPVDLFSPPTFPRPILPPAITNTPPPLLLCPVPILPPAKDSGSLTPSRRRSSAISVICDMCFEFLQLDDRPTAILEVQPTGFQLTAVGRLNVNILFTNPAFEHLKPQLKLDFESSASMGGILQQADGKLVWVVPNGNWELRCVSISRGAVTGEDTVVTIGGGHRWWKVMTANPVLPLTGSHIPGKKVVDGHLDTVDPMGEVVAPEAQLENFGGIGEGDIQSITEELPQGISKPSIVTTNEPGDAGDWTHSPSRTITPSHTGGMNSARRSLLSSTIASRRSSQSLPSSRRDSSSVGIPEAVAERSEPPSILSESALDGKYGNSLNMDWTRGAMPLKNTLSISGMDEHLRFLMNVPW